jgi:hypothetical protein
VTASGPPPETFQKRVHTCTPRMPTPGHLVPTVRRPPIP